MIRPVVESLRRAWEIVVRPSVLISSPDERIQANLLAGTTLIFLCLVIVATFIGLPVALSGSTDTESAHGILFILGLGAMGATALSFSLSRTRYYQIGAFIFASSLMMGVYAAAMVSQIGVLGRSLIILWLPLIVLAASMFLSTRATVVLGVIGIAGTVFLPLVSTLFNVTNMAGPLTYTLGLYSLTVFSKHYRDRLEAQRHSLLTNRQHELETREAALRESEQKYRALYATAERQSQELRLLDQVRTALALEVDFPTLLGTIMKSITETFGYTQVSLYLLKGNALVLQRQVGYDHVIEEIPVTRGVSGRVVRTGKPVLIPDVHSDPEFLGAIPGIVSEICVPLSHDGQVVGMLNVESTHELRFTEADLALMVALSKDIEVAIGRARLYENIQQELAERKRTEEALLEARSFLQQVVDTSPGMIFIVDGESRILFVNQFMAQYYGSTPEALISKTSGTIHSRAAEVRTFVNDDQLVIRTRTRIVKDEINTAPNGEQHWFHTIKVPLLRPDGTVDVLGFATDITELKRIEEEVEHHRAHLEELVEKRTAELQAANEHLAALSRVKDEFVSNVSHELRTPLTSIKLNIELMIRKPEKRSAYLETLARETTRLQNLIEGLLSLSRMDSGGLQVNFQPFSLNGLVKEIATDRMPLAENKHLTLSVELAAELPIVSADPFLVGQVLSILLTNALNYSPVGGAIGISTQSCQSDGRLWVGFGVSDTGPGIDPGEANKLFTRFFRGKAGLASGVGGTGLGLAIVKAIIERHEGRVEAFNNPSPATGATFRVWLPV